MKNEPIDKSVSDRICKHMNSDHMDAIIKFASHYGRSTEFKTVLMTKLTSNFIELEVDQEIIKISFDHTLQNSEDAHKTLVKMVKAISQ
tara:strand:+ start:441 stop:707 length:267 start_codon:yes stop_codon:yes gene_type:complete